MPDSGLYDFVIIGGGIIGTATAMALQKDSGYKILIIEAEDKLAAHQTGNNSGVVHSGLYYKPGSLKTKNSSCGWSSPDIFCFNSLACPWRRYFYKNPSAGRSAG